MLLTLFLLSLFDCSGSQSGIEVCHLEGCKSSGFGDKAKRKTQKGEGGRFKWAYRVSVGQLILSLMSHWWRTVGREYQVVMKTEKEGEGKEADIEVRIRFEENKLVIATNEWFLTITANEWFLTFCNPHFDYYWIGRIISVQFFHFSLIYLFRLLFWKLKLLWFCLVMSQIIENVPFSFSELF